MKIKKLTITQFKGVSKKVIEFGDVTKIKGQNGVGKTTVADAFYWLFCNKDYEITDNPNIRPNNMEESLPAVEAVLDVNGVEVTFSKQQKCKTTGTKTSLTNTYEINAVPKTEKDVKEYFNEKGIDLDKMLLMSHTSVFTSGINDKKVRDDRRNILFSMIENVTDYDVSKTIPECSDITKLLTDYSVEEITAMQSSTLSKIKETYGKNGELIDNRIIGMESAKVTEDISEYELQKKTTLEAIKDVENKLADFNKIYEANKKKGMDILDLKLKLNNIESKSIESDVDANINRNKKIAEIKNKINEINAKGLMDALNRLQSDKDRQIANKEGLKTKYLQVKKMEFDESSCTCKYCGQDYPEEKKAELKMSFEATKTKDLQNIADNGNRINANIKEIEAAIAEQETKISENEKLMAELIKQLAEAEKIAVVKTDYKNSDEYKAIEEEIAKQEKELAEMEKADDQQLKNELTNLNADLAQIERKIGTFDINIKIDEQISALEDKKLELAQNKADCEKILYQLKLLSQRKNEMLSDAVNKHFDLVKFELFEYQKNGEVKDTCKATIDGKDFSECNGALKTLAKLDIVNGLQKFFKVEYPIFIDEYEHITSNTNSRIKSDSQLIQLSCTEDSELIVEGI